MITKRRETLRRCYAMLRAGYAMIGYRYVLRSQETPLKFCLGCLKAEMQDRLLAIEWRGSRSFSSWLPNNGVCVLCSLANASHAVLFTYRFGNRTVPPQERIRKQRKYLRVTIRRYGGEGDSALRETNSQLGAVTSLMLEVQLHRAELARCGLASWKVLEASSRLTRQHLCLAGSG